MGLLLDAEQRQMADSALEVLSRYSDSAAVRAAIAAGGFDPALWRRVADLGWCGVHLPESCGGLGLGSVELALLAESLGYHLACVPWLESAVLAGTALQRSQDGPARERWLPAVAAGDCIATLALGSAGLSFTGEIAALQALTTASGWRLQGTLAPVPAAAAAGLLLLPAQGDGGEPLLLAVPADSPGLQIEPLLNHDATRPLARLRLHGVELTPEHLLARGAAVAGLLTHTEQTAAVVLAAEQVGLAQRCLDLSVAYTGQRVQFGQPVARFQAIKHRCAEMMVAVELARSAVAGAARALDDQPDQSDPRSRLQQAAMARCQASAAAQFCAQEVIQLHGGMGYTWDCDAHLLFKRAQAASQWLGPPSRWAERWAAAWLDDEEAGHDVAH